MSSVFNQKMRPLSKKLWNCFTEWQPMKMLKLLWVKWCKLFTVPQINTLETLLFSKLPNFAKDFHQLINGICKLWKFSLNLEVSTWPIKFSTTFYVWLLKVTMSKENLDSKSLPRWKNSLIKTHQLISS